MKGIDVSHWQGSVDWAKVRKDGVEFAILKCTEAIKYVDATFSKNKKDARTAGVLLGFYHFARGNDPVQEADFFLSNVGDIQEGEFLVLDYEIDLPNAGDWCKKWLDRVYEKAGFRPILYSNEARIVAVDFTQVAKANYGLWIAKYGDNDQLAEDNEIPNTDEWKYFAIWQFSSTGAINGISTRVDLNYTSMDIKTLKKYGKPHVEQSQPSTDYKALYESEQSKRKEAEQVRDQYLEKIKYQDGVIAGLKGQLDKIKELSKY